jgi:hypothetical protein
LKKPEAPRRIISAKDEDEPGTETLIDLISLEKRRMKTKIEQARKPLYLARYE